MQNRRNAAILALSLAVAGCFQAPSSKSKQTEQKGQYGVFFIVNLSRPIGGSIQSTDGQLNCGTAGSGRDACGPAQYSWTTTATLNAVPDAGQLFQSWAGDCGNTGVCTLDTVSNGADKYVAAIFSPPDRVGHANIPDPKQHGPLFFDFVKKVPNTPKCNTCHGPTYTGLGNAPSCEACHAQAGFPNWLNNCTFCHTNPPPSPHVQSTNCSACHAGYGDKVGTGTQATNAALHMNGAVDVSGAACTTCHGTPGVNAAPPFDLSGGTATTQVSVGAHQAHLGTTRARAVACSECHVVPSDMTHATTPPPNRVVFGSLAGQGVTATWTRATATCATYCHGGSAALAGGTGTTPVWNKVDGTYAACASCHGAPPPAPHPQNSDCGACHTGYTIVSTNAATHVNGVVDVRPLTCTSCHGTEGRTGTDPYLAAAPPTGTKGETLPTQAAVGAHQAHLAAGPIARAFACTDCHAPPTSNTHATGTTTFSWSVLAGGSAVTYTPATQTCSNVYCHGAFTGGNRANTPVWTAGAAGRACGTCHGVPPAAPHSQSLACGNCHAGYSATSVNVANHVNGVVDVVPLSCTSCHGTAGVNAAPPLDTAGGNGTGFVSVGAHQAHVTTALMAAPIACSECHGPAAAFYGVGHSDGTVQVLFGATANAGTSTVWTRGTATCSASYCHGGTATVAGGTGTSPVWTVVNGTYRACTSCHGAPPPAPHAQDANCGGCHTGYTSTTVNAALHLNRTVDVSAQSCSACHGAPPATASHRTAGALTTCVTCHDQTVDAAGAILTAGKHRNGAVDLSLAMNCAKCHGTPGRAPNPTAFTDSVEAAPPNDLSGNAVASAKGVGAHLVHVNGTRSANLRCSECHDVSSILTGLYGHANGTVDMAWGTLASAGGTPSYSYGSGGSCSATYCHGNFPGGNGAGASPSWTVAGTLACTSCHGNPPALSATVHHPANADCATCHGAGYSSSTVVQSSHVDGTVQKPAAGCTACHGALAGLSGAAVASGSLAAAPGFSASAVDTAGNSAATSAGVGAHAAHLTGSRWRATAVACAECHVVPATGDVAHATGTGSGGARATVTFGALARTGNITTAAYAGSATGSGGTTAGTCSNVYCHGNFRGSGAPPSVSWTGGSAAAACGTCHGVPPPAPHSQSTDCGTCHAGYTNATVDATAHLNGSVDVSNLTCTSCHGTDGVNAAPPRDTTGGTQVSLVSVGAHQAHLGATLAAPLTCGQCHGAASDAYGTGHSDGVVQVAFGALANQGTTTAWTRGSATCAASYCHGGSSALAGGTGTSPVWTTVDGTFKGCTSCHGAPPPASAHHPANAACGTCHGSGYTSSTVDAAKHVDGTVQKPAAGCTACHGVLAGVSGAAVASGSLAAAPGFDASAVDTAGNSGATFAGVGAHRAHLSGSTWSSTPVACAECHAVPADGDLAHATGTGSGGARATLTFGTLAKTGLGATAAYAGSATAAGGSTAGTCSNVYCHGGFNGSGVSASLSWTGGTAAAACGSCHGNPPPAPHVQNTTCGDCHAGYTNTSVQASTHLNGVVDVATLACTSCHGDAARTGVDPYIAAMPPVGTAGETLPTQAAVGAHQVHLAAGTLSRAFACIDCHNPPTDTRHATGTTAFSWSVLAGGSAVRYDAAGKTCSNVYCHGSFSGGTTANAPSWTGGTAQAACGSCHGVPPAAPHTQSTACEGCHSGYTSTTVNLTDHVNGLVDLTLSCTSCHGTEGRVGVAGADPRVAVAPPVVASATGLAGAHLAHVNQGHAPALSQPFACATCHVLPTQSGHSNGIVEVVYSGVAVTGGAAPPAYDATGHSCASTYCHGNFTGGNQGTGALSWAGATKLACTACHGAPPPRTAAAPHPQNAACESCHDGYTSTTVAAATHVNGSVQKPASGCTACHGVLAGQSGAAVAASSPTVAPGSSAAAVDSTGSSATSARGVGAHFRHLTPTVRAAIACSECHGALPGAGDTSHVNGTVALSWGTTASGNGATAPSAPVAAGTLSCSATWCHGDATGLSGAANARPTWNAATLTAMTCTSCHGNPPTGLGHPNNGDCATCHGTGYTRLTATTGSITGAALATHVNGTVDLVAAESCTSCHGAAGRATGGIAGASYDANLAASPPADSRGSSTGVLVGAHLAHVNPGASTIVGGAAQPTGGVMKPLACIECHPAVATNQHASGAVNVTFAAATVANLDNWTTTFVQGGAPSGATTCATYCHGASLGSLYQGTATNPAWDGVAAACNSCHGFPPSTQGHNGVASLSTACAGCHSATVKADGTIDLAGGHHVDGVQDVVKGNGCAGCHAVAASMQLATTYQHVMAQDPGAAYPVNNGAPPVPPNPQFPDSDRNCNVCHMKHEFPNQATNLRNTINSATPTAASSDTALCVSCHGQNSMTKDATRQKTDGTTATPVVLEADFTGSAHDYTVQGSFGASNFTVNCVKCHNSTDATTYQTGAKKFVLHTSPDRRLRAPLGRATLTDDDSANFCYRCHSASTDAVGGTPKAATANDWYGAVTTMPASATGVFAQMQKGVAGTAAGLPTTTTNTLYFKPLAAETPSGTLPAAHLSTTDTFAGGTFVARSMSPYATATAYESQTTTNETVTATTQNWRRVSFVSPTVATGFTTPAAAWTLNVFDRESSGNANARVRYAIYTIDAAGALKASIVARANGGTEMGTTAAPGTQQTITTAAGAAVAVAAGDRIVVDLEIQSLTVATAGSYAMTYFFGSGAASNVVMPSSAAFNYASQATPASGRHDVGAYVGKHKPNPAEEHLQYIAANKHVDCADCHDPHRAKRGNQGDAGTVSATAAGCSNSTTSLCDTAQAWPVDAWKGYYLDTYTISSGANVSRAQITANTASQVTTGGTITLPIASTVGYRISMRANGGAVTAATASTLTDGGSIGGTKTWTANAFAGWTVQIVYGTGMGQVATIASNTGNQVTINGTWATTPTTTSRYMITKMPNVMLGTSGVNVTAWGVGSPTAWNEGKTFNPAAGSTTVLPDATSQWQVCFKCHSSANTALSTWKSTWTDLAADFNPRNQSYHPVLAPAGAVAATGYGNTTVGGTLSSGWRTGDTMTCSDCHGNDSQAAGASHGPHASAVAYVLKGPNAYWPFQSNGTTRWTTSNTGTGLFCFNCHGTLSGVHTRGEHAGTACTACHIRLPHGGKVKRLIRTANTTAPYADTGVGSVLNAYAGGSSDNSTSCGTSCTTHHALPVSTTNSW